VTSLRFIMTGVLMLACGDTSRSAPAREEKREPAPRGAEPGTHVDEPAHEEMPKQVRLSEQVIKNAGVRTAPAAREVLPITLGLPGEVSADPDKSGRISAPIAGRIEQVSFKEGDRVKKGQVLAQLRVRDLGQLRSAYTASLTRAKAARTNADRLKDLSAQRLASEQAYVDAVAAADALDAETRAAEQQLAALGVGESVNSSSLLALRAPISGIVVSRNAVVAQPVSAEEILGDVVDLSEVWFLGRVFEKDLSRLKLGARVEVQLNAYPDQRFQGTVEYIGRQVDPVARTLTARVRLRNQDDLLRVGLFGTAYVSTSTEQAHTPVLTVPRTALTEIAGKSAVFVQHADGDFERHDVVLGESAGGKVQIVSGLREGEQVVVEGVFTLTSALLKSTFAEEE
jgi:cobalt-zinc-cadmium efflux system membrane fusion protein